MSSSFIFGQFPVARKLIINGGAIRPTGLLFNIKKSFCNIKKSSSSIRNSFFNNKNCSIFF